MSWRLFSGHCRGERHRRMALLLSLMERNEESGEVTTFSDFRDALGGRFPYRTMYAAESNGFIRPVLVPKRGRNGRRGRAFVSTDLGRDWLRGHEAFVASLAPPAGDGGAGVPARLGRRPGTGMVPMSQVDSRLASRRREALSRHREAMRGRTGR